jgi:hypothetical protein
MGKPMWPPYAPASVENVSTRPSSTFATASKSSLSVKAIGHPGKDTEKDRLGKACTDRPSTTPGV